MSAATIKKTKEVIIINTKELAFSYFEANPRAVQNRENANHYKALGIKESTYNNYKMEYREILRARETKELKLRDPEKYFKGRLRNKFIFDDSKLSD